MQNLYYFPLSQERNNVVCCKHAFFLAFCHFGHKHKETLYLVLMGAR